MEIRAFRRDDAPALAELSAACGRGESDFVLNPLWETEDELFAEFERHGVEPETHLLVADAGGDDPAGLAGFLRQPGAPHAGLFCPIVRRDLRGRGLGGRILRAALELGREALDIAFVTAAVGTRNRAGYSLLTAHGFRPARQVYVMRCDERPKAEPAPADLALEPATAEDAEAILEIYATCGFEPRSADDMRALLGDGRHAHTVARRADEVVGFVELETHWPRRPWVAYVGVQPELRARGLGSALVAHALARRFEEGAHAGLLMLSPANRTALRAYEKVGFRRWRLLDVLERIL